MITERQLLDSGFKPFAGIGKPFRKEYPNGVTVDVSFTSNGTFTWIRVLNEFSEPYCKDEEISIELNAEDLQSVLEFAASIKRVTVDSRIV